jgi:DNA polymerase III sliding clamp (beta) subunit (PCNA family)
MSKTIKIKNKSAFIKNFLLPISKVSDSVVLDVSDNNISCLTCTSDNSVILHSSFPVELDFEDGEILNCPDIKKLIRAVDATNSGDEVSFELQNNNLSYKDKTIRFKYHLLEDGIIKKPKLSLQKLQSTEFDVEFEIVNAAIKDMMRGAVFSSDSNKIYISANKDGVYGELTDKSINNIDSIILRISDSYKGEGIENTPFNFDIFRLMEISSNDILVKINKKLGVAMFEIPSNYNKMFYIASSLIK